MTESGERTINFDNTRGNVLAITQAEEEQCLFLLPKSRMENSFKRHWVVHLAESYKMNSFRLNIEPEHLIKLEKEMIKLSLIMYYLHLKRKTNFTGI